MLTPIEAVDTALAIAKARHHGGRTPEEMAEWEAHLRSVCPHPDHYISDRPSPFGMRPVCSVCAAHVRYSARPYRWVSL